MSSHVCFPCPRSIHLAKRKSPKRRRPCCARPFAALRATCDARSGGAPQNSLRAARSVQTTAASQCTKCVCPSSHARTPCPALLGTHRREPRERTSTRAIASLGPACAARGACARERGPSEAMARRAVWMSGCLDVRLPHPCWLRLRRGGCGVSMGVAAPMPRALTRRGCLNEAAKQRSEFHGAPRNRPAAGCPVATRRGRRLGVAFLLGTFLWRSKEQVPRPPGRDPASALHPCKPSKKIATSDHPISARGQFNQRSSAPPGAHCQTPT